MMFTFLGLTPSNAIPPISIPHIGNMKDGSEVSGVPGVYVLCDERLRPLYCGQSGDIGRRAEEHRKAGKEFDHVRWLPLHDVSERLRLEGLLTLAHLPALNNVLCLRLANRKVSEMYYQGLWRRKRKGAGRN